MRFFVLILLYLPPEHNYFSFMAKSIMRKVVILRHTFWDVWKKVWWSVYCDGSVYLMPNKKTENVFHRSLIHLFRSVFSEVKTIKCLKRYLSLHIFTNLPSMGGIMVITAKRLSPISCFYFVVLNFRRCSITSYIVSTQMMRFFFWW